MQPFQGLRWPRSNANDGLLHVVKAPELVKSHRGVMVTVVGNEHSDTSSHPGRD